MHASYEPMTAVTSNQFHVLRRLFPPIIECKYSLRPRKHDFVQSPKDDKNFISRVLQITPGTFLPKQQFFFLFFIFNVLKCCGLSNFSEIKRIYHRVLHVVTRLKDLYLMITGNEEGCKKLVVIEGREGCAGRVCWQLNGNRYNSFDYIS